MALIQFTRNHSDHSTDKGYQFEFFCDRCGNGFMSEFHASAVGMAASAVRVVDQLVGGWFGRVGSSSYEIERAVQGPGHDKAFREAINEAKVNFRQCPKCSHWVCGATCWNDKRMLCYDCAPDIQTEMASAQVHTAVEQMKEKLREQDLTKDLNLTAEATALCPACGARTQGAKFCPDCGKPLRAKSECNRCGTKVDAGAKFCPECGNRFS
ncbi:MAG TPA: zinc ribbon domain-containing protein [Bryobacteraceae bacterium]|nr:zinc ribbon domain-containing protein [Bryobacteraceae bacterium]